MSAKRDGHDTSGSARSTSSDSRVTATHTRSLANSLSESRQGHGGRLWPRSTSRSTAPVLSPATMSASVPVVQTRPKGAYVSVSCVHCQTALEYLPLPAASHPPDQPFSLECAQCHQTWIVRPQKPRPAGKRRIGTGARRFSLEGGGCALAGSALTSSGRTQMTSRSRWSTTTCSACPSPARRKTSRRRTDDWSVSLASFVPCTR